MSTKTAVKRGRKSVKTQIKTAMEARTDKEMFTGLDTLLAGVTDTETAREKVNAAFGLNIAYSTFRAFLNKGPIAGKFPKTSPLYNLANLRPGRRAGAVEAVAA